MLGISLPLHPGTVCLVMSFTFILLHVIIVMFIAFPLFSLWIAILVMITCILVTSSTRPSHLWLDFIGIILLFPLLPKAVKSSNTIIVRLLWFVWLFSIAYAYVTGLDVDVVVLLWELC